MTLRDVQLGSLGGALARRLAIAGVVALAIAVAWGAALGDDLRRLSFAMVIAVAFWLSLAVGALFFAILQHLVRARWSVTLRRIAEVLTGAFPVVGAVLLGAIALPPVFGYHGLYEWADPELAHADHLIHAKGAWFAPAWFAARCALYVVAWSLLARWFRRRSIEQDDSKDPALSERMRVASAPAVIAFALVTAFASFDVLMSLEPRWFSTIFPVYFFAGSAVAVFAALALVPLWLQRRGLLKEAVTVEHYHDVGKLLFAFVFFWGYIAFSQFMLIWYAAVPEETFWFADRLRGGWQWVSLALLLCHFVIPFLGLMSRHGKRDLRVLAFWAVWALAAHYLDLVWLVLPEYSAAATFHAIDLLALAGVGGLALAAVARTASRAALVPTGDPNLATSLSFENM